MPAYTAAVWLPPMVRIVNPIDKQPDQKRCANSDKDACVHPCAEKALQPQLRRHLYRLGIVPPFWVTQYTEEQGGDEIGGDIVHQNGGEDLVHPQLQLTEHAHSSIGRAAEHTT